MSSTLARLFQYNQEANQRYIEVFEQSDVLAIPDKAISLFSHILNAHSIWLARIQKQTPPFAVWQLHAIPNFQQINTQNFEESKALLDNPNFPLDQKIRYQNSKGTVFQNSIEDILLHVVNHSTYHRAQLAQLLKSSELVVPNSDYIAFMRESH